jgi:hypothetical protein
MKTTEEKANFMRMFLISEICALKPDEKGLWGKMNAQQMIEHLGDAFRNYPEADHEKMRTPAEQLEKYRAFMMSEKPFRPDTVNPGLSSNPAPPRFKSFEESLDYLSESIEYFFSQFDDNPETIIPNPVFGNLNYEEAVHLLYKHVTHHLIQFRIIG